jgi:diaminopimelate epimerase
MKIKIDYYSGAGNIFSIFDNRSKIIVDTAYSNLALALCSGESKFSLGTEGLIIIEENESNPFLVKFYNPDGSSGMMCGNGARCAVKYGLENSLIDLNENNCYTFNLAGIEYKAKLESNLIKVFFPKPNFHEIKYLISAHGRKLSGMLADVGTIHLIFNYQEVPNSENFDFEYYPIVDFAQEIRYNLELFPNGTNVSICRIIDENNLELRTYEKGVEAETGACGTGAIAAALLNFLAIKVKKIVKVIPTSKIPLFVETIIKEDNVISGFSLMGEAVKIGKTEINFEKYD